MGGSAGTSQGRIWRKASPKVVMFAMRSEGRGRPAGRLPDREEEQSKEPGGGRESLGIPECGRGSHVTKAGDRGSGGKRQRDARRVRSWQTEEECVGRLHCCPLWGAGILGRWPPGMGKEVGFRTEEFPDASSPQVQGGGFQKELGYCLAGNIGSEGFLPLTWGVCSWLHLYESSVQTQGAADFFSSIVTSSYLQTLSSHPRRLENAAGFTATIC